MTTEDQIKPTALKRGQIVFLKRPVRFLRATVVAVYDHFPAVRVRMGNKAHETLIPSKGILTAEERAAIPRAAIPVEVFKQRLQENHAGIISRWKPGMSSEDWRLANGWNIGEWQIICQLKRMGIIT